MFDFLEDTENIDLNKNISSLIEKQLPSFIRDEGENFIIFLKKYYEWLEAHELVYSDVVQFEYLFKLDVETDDFLLLEDNVSRIILESDRDETSAFEEDEIVDGLSSGAIGIVDRKTTTADSLIFIKNNGKIDFLPGETIKGRNNRTEATVTSYYKNPLFSSRTLLKNLDLNLSTTSFINQFAKTFLADVPEDLSSDKSLIIKHIIDVYRSKGSKTSYDFLFKSLYDIQDLVYYSPKTDLWKASNGNWVSEKTLRIVTDDPIDYFDGRQIIGRVSQATAVVDRVLRFASGVQTITELYLLDLNGTFVIGETVDSSLFDGNFGSGIAQGVLTNISVQNPGTNYKIGDTVTISGGGGSEATAVVKSIATGTLTDFTVYDGGDGYRKSTQMTVNNFGTRGSGFAGKISEVVESFSFPSNDDLILNHYYKRLNIPEFGFSGNPANNIEDRLIDTLGFNVIDAGSIVSVKTTTVGVNYAELPQISITEANTSILSDESIRIINLNPDPDDFGRTPAITGAFIPGERIFADGGHKIGTYFTNVAETDDDITDPKRIRVKPIQYLGIYGVGRNDFLIDTENYINPDTPTVYDLLITFSGDLTPDKFVFRRGLDARNALDIYNESTDINYTDTEFDIEGAFQKLRFPIESLTQSSGVATATTSGRHGLFDEQKVIITNSADSDYNGEKVISVISDTEFQFAINPSAPSEATPDTDAKTGSTDINYDENVSVKFIVPFKHANSTISPGSPDRYLFSTVDFDEGDVITGFRSGAQATVNTGGTVYSPGGQVGNNAVVNVIADQSSTGSIAEIEITNPGVGYTTRPTVSLTNFGSGDARISASIGTIGDIYGRYFDENGFFSYSKKIIDSYFYQDFSYSLRSSKQLNEYEQLVKKLLHPVGSKLFGEFAPQNDELNFSFDNSIILEDGSFIEIEGSFDKLLTEQYYEPTHNVDLELNKTIEQTVRITGGSNFVVNDSLEYFILSDNDFLIFENGDKFYLESTVKGTLNETFPSNTFVIIDDEQGFYASYGEFRLENFLNGKISADSQNIISRVIVSETTSNFEPYETVVQVKSDNSAVSAIVLRHELDSQNNNVLLLHTSNGYFDQTSNIESAIQSSGILLENGVEELLLETESFLILEDSKYSEELNYKTAAINEVKSNVIFGNTSYLDIDNVSNIDLGNTTVTVTTLYPHSMRYKDQIFVQGGSNTNLNGIFTANVINTTSFSYDTTTVIQSYANVDNIVFKIQRGTDFQNDLSANDIVKFNTSKDTFEVLEIINSSCLIANTNPNSDNTFNFVTQKYESILFEDESGVLNLNTREAKLSAFNILSEESFLILQQNVRGTTSANGLRDGTTTIYGVDSFFREDLLVGDIISLSSKPEFDGKILSIVSYEYMILNDSSNTILNLEDGSRFELESSPDEEYLQMNVSMGTGDPSQKIILRTTKNLDLEDNPNEITLSGKYDGTNNYMRITNSNLSDDVGLLLLDDGVGYRDAEYVGNVSTEGSFKFEDNTTYNNQIIKFVEPVDY